MKISWRGKKFSEPRWPRPGRSPGVGAKLSSSSRGVNSLVSREALFARSAVGAVAGGETRFGEGVSGRRRFAGGSGISRGARGLRRQELGGREAEEDPKERAGAWRASTARTRPSRQASGRIDNRG